MVGCVLMASGAGRRFGSNKLLSAVEGVPLHRRAMAALAPAGFGRLVVCSPYPEVLSAGAEYGFRPPGHPGGGGGSAPPLPPGGAPMDRGGGGVFGVCVQPWLTTESVRRLLDAFSDAGDAICALSWRGTRGSPVIFPACFFGELAALTGDTGGSAVLRRHPERLRLVEASSPRELMDVDTPADLSR